MAALEMKKRLKKLNSSRIKEGKVSFRHGIGIHTGVLLAGNTGSEDQPSYALIGDAVNVASRLQGLTKDLGTEIIISATTRKRLDDSFQLKELQAARIRGRSESLKIFAVDGIISAK
jgi:adenylate cyclase